MISFFASYYLSPLPFFPSSSFPPTPFPSPPPLSQVNGFEVYDPEEAILLFLEQDQDITLTIARKHSNNVSNRVHFLIMSLTSSLPLREVVPN